MEPPEIVVGSSVSPREFLVLAGVGLENKFYNARLFWREARELGSQLWWWRLRLAMRLAYLFESPFRVSRREGPGAGLPWDDLIYGETPVLTAWQILSELGVGPDDTVVDLGCGRGHTVLVAALAFGCRGVGLEVLPSFVKRSHALARSLSLETVEFLQADYRFEELPEATVYFVAPTTLTSESLSVLKHKMLAAPEGAMAVSITSALPRLGWETLDVRKRAYSWGLATTYLQRRK